MCGEPRLDILVKKARVISCQKKNKTEWMKDTNLIPGTGSIH